MSAPGAPLALIAAGGTGGHMYPAQALAETLLARGWRVVLSTDARGARYAGGFPEAVTIRQVSAATFARGGLAARALVPFRLAAGVLGAIVQLWRDRPAAVVGFGGYPSVPALTAAWLLRLPRMLHEQNGVPGRVNRFFAPRVDVVACGTWPADLPAGVKGLHTGNPVRGSIAARAGAGYIPPGDYPMSLLVIGGSQGARVLSDVVPAAVAALPEALRVNLRIAQQARPEDVARVLAAYEAAGLPAEVAPFFADIPARLSEAQLVIARAGASTLAEIAVVGRPAILIPYAAATADHQAANARGPVDAGAAIVVPEDRLDPETLAARIRSVLEDSDGALRMSLAALTVARPDAATALADLVERLARKEPPA